MSNLSENSKNNSKTIKIQQYFSDFGSWISKKYEAFWKLPIYYIIATFVILGIITSQFLYISRISGSSMEPTLHSNSSIAFGIGHPIDKLLKGADSIDYNIKRGDIIVVDRNTIGPEHAKKDGKMYYIKRVIGMPMEKITFTDDGKVQICPLKQNEQNKLSGLIEDVKIIEDNCFILDEPYLAKNTKTDGSVCGRRSYVITKGYFVMGDNRGNSSDSRCGFNIGDGSKYYEVMPENIAYNSLFTVSF